jgi:hypothetical protein
MKLNLTTTTLFRNTQNCFKDLNSYIQEIKFEWKMTRTQTQTVLQTLCLAAPTFES